MSRTLPILLLCGLLLAGCEGDGGLAPSRSRGLQLQAATPLQLSDGRWVELDASPDTAPIPLMEELRCAGALLEQSRGLELVAQMTSPQEGHFSVDVPAPSTPGRRGHLEFEYWGESGGILRLGGRSAQNQPQPSALSQRVEAGRWEVIRFALDDPRLSEKQPTRLCILPPAAELGEVRVRAMRYLPPLDIHGSWLKLGEQRREALLLRPDTALEWETRVAPGAELQFGFGNASGHARTGDGVHFFVDMIRGGGQAERIWTRSLLAHSNPSHGHWQDARIRIPVERVREVRLRIGVLASPPREDPFEQAHSVAGDRPVISAPRIESVDDARPNVVLIVIDTLRADGFTRETMPRLFARRDEFVLFDKAYATGAWTHPSTGSIWSGLMPEEHGLGGSGSSVSHFDPSVPLLPEILREAGYATAAVSNNLIISPTEGFARGMDSFDERLMRHAAIHGAERVTSAGLEWLRGRSNRGPFFLYLHYFDPHDRYAPPADFVDSFAGGIEWDELPSGIREGKVRGLIDQMVQNSERTDFEPPAEQVAALWALYRAEILYADFWIDRLLQGMEERGQLENTLVIISSDHGEEFYEHGGFKHGHSLHEELLRVPLAIRFPDGAHTGRSIESPASLIDLLPTILESVGEDASPFPGEDLRRWLDAGPPERRAVGAVLFESAGRSHTLPHSAAQALWREQHKLFREFPRAVPELYDLAADPRESNDLAGSELALRDELRALMDRFLGSDAPRSGAEQELDPELAEKLRALGYVD